MTDAALKKRKVLRPPEGLKTSVPRSAIKAAVKKVTAQRKRKETLLALVKLASETERIENPFAGLDPANRERYLRALKAGREFNEKILGETDMTKNNEEQAHATLSASGSAGWLNCPGKIKAERGLPDTGSAHAEEGTVAHHLGEMSLFHNKPTSNWLGHKVIVKKGEVSEVRPEMAPEKISEQEAYGNTVYEFTQEMCDYVQEYVDYVFAIEADDLMIETRVDFSRWTVEGQFGTADAIVVEEGGKKATIVDLKYGKGVKVFVEDNSQAMLYALGVVEDLEMIYDIDEFTLVIHQPRLDHVDEWTISKADLLAWGEDVVKPAAELAMTEDAPRIAGDKQCQWCKVGKANCPAAVEYAFEAACEEFDMAEFKLNDVGNLDVSAKAFIHERKAFIVDLLNQNEVDLHDTIKGGDEVPGFKLVEGRSNRVWRDPEAVEALLKKTKKVKSEDMYTKKLKGPAPLEKLLGKTHKIITENVHKPEGKPTLVAESDKREALVFDFSEEFEDV